MAEEMKYPFGKPPTDPLAERIRETLKPNADVMGVKLGDDVEESINSRLGELRAMEKKTPQLEMVQKHLEELSAMLRKPEPFASARIDTSKQTFGVKRK